MRRSSLCLRAVAVLVLLSPAALAHHHHPTPAATPLPPPPAAVAPAPPLVPGHKASDGETDDDHSLGGPAVPLAPSAGGGATAPATPSTGPATHPAPNSVSPVGPPTSPSGAWPSTVGQPSVPLGPPPFDLGAVKRINVAGVLVDATPLRVGNLDVLAPIVDQLAQLGATVTRADPSNIPGGLSQPTQDQYFQLNLPEGPPIVLAMGRATAWLGTNEITLRAAPLSLNNQIWLPVASIAPLLAAASKLDDDGTLSLTPTIESVELFPVKGSVGLTIKASAPITDGAVVIKSLKDKLYLDFPGYSMGFDSTNSNFERVVAPATGEVLRARAGMPKNLTNTTRITLDLQRQLDYQLSGLPDKSLFALVLTPPGEAVPAPLPDVSSPPVAIDYVPGSGSLQGVTVVVDPGHGGFDTGARGSNSLEKNDTLDIALRLRDALIARHANVLMTRDTDTFVSLDYRTTFANAHHATVFVSVHINASVNKNSTGTETFYYTALSQSLAREVHKELARATGCPDRGIAQARFYVVRKTWMPSVLTESAFITNEHEQALLNEAPYRQRIANAIAQGITNYIRIYGKGGSSG